MRGILILIIASSLGSCSSVKYATEQLDNNYIVKEKTYNIESECDKGINANQEIRVANTIHQYFRKRGYRQSKNPELIIQFLIKEDIETYVSMECNYYGRWLYGNECSVRFDSYSEGSIVIDVINAKSSSIMWHGVISSPPFKEIEDSEINIPHYVNKLMRKYPY